MPNGMLHIKFYAPERAALEFDAAEIVVPGGEGVFTVMPGHTPLLSTILPGVVVVYDAQDNQQFYAVAGGFCEVRDDQVTLLATAYEPGEQVEVPRAEQALERAEIRLKKPEPGLDIQRAELAIARARARLHASRREGY
ncbi:MAG: ATP synthase F1 subunit epsilon [Candidatus Hydrogenedentes bacterium]|nr:ATP synthase F1 subunit epsilon [Candidatus Hydrogenedentota bacterium]